jgi:2-polyprenyl-3-methyl-5-hydroxy-6-metoxy-1,4-benzoquinol methylase
LSDSSEIEYQQQLDQARQIWDSEAAVFDEQPDHGLRDPLVLAAWTKLLKTLFPSGNGHVLDIGCGTGSLSLVLAGLGYTVTGIDFSPEMIAHAQVKAAASGHAIEFHLMDAAYPQFAPEQFDVILCRHVLWALLNIDQVLERWVRLLKTGGRIILIEGLWHTGAGLPAQAIVDALPDSLTNVAVQNLSDQSALWGGAVNDERYIMTAKQRAKR